MKYARSRDWARAEAAFSKAVHGHPEDPLYLLNLARSQMESGGIDKARRNAMVALALDPDNLTARRSPAPA